MHQNQLAHAPDVVVDTCYGCGGLYVPSAGLSKLDAAAHHPAPTTSQPATAAEREIGKTIDVMVQKDERRAQVMANLMNYRFGGPAIGNPYFTIAGV